MPATLRKQSGLTLIESLISILIFSLGILGLAGLQANAIKMSTDAKYRADAAFLANDLIGRISLAAPADDASLNFNAWGDDVTPSCLTDGTATSAHAEVSAWLTQVNAALPNAPSKKQRIKFEPDPKNVLHVMMCWQAPNGSEHWHTVTTQLQRQ